VIPFLDKYHDLIINSLDLVSFILVAPQLIDAIAPSLAKIVIAELFVVAIALSGLVSFDLSGVLIFSAIVLIASRTIDMFPAKFTLWGPWLSKHAFGLAASTFFAARILSFIASLRDLAAHPS
jgi:hypothetical protein